MDNLQIQRRQNKLDLKTEMGNLRINLSTEIKQTKTDLSIQTNETHTDIEKINHKLDGIDDKPEHFEEVIEENFDQAATDIQNTMDQSIQNLHTTPSQPREYCTRVNQLDIQDNSEILMMADEYQVIQQQKHFKSTENITPIIALNQSPVCTDVESTMFEQQYNKVTHWTLRNYVVRKYGREGSVKFNHTFDETRTIVQKHQIKLTAYEHNLTFLGSNHLTFHRHSKTLCSSYPNLTVRELSKSSAANNSATNLKLSRMKLQFTRTELSMEYAKL